MRKIALLLVMLTSRNVWGNKYSEYQSNPNILIGATGSDDTAFVVFFALIFFGSFAVAHFFKKKFYTPFKEVILYIVICIVIGYFWMMNN